jgi:hypothetical protein
MTRFKNLAVALVLLGGFIFQLFTSGPHAQAFAGGDGSVGDPFQVVTCADMQNMRYDMDGNYTLANDIDCSDTVNWNSGVGFKPVGVQSNSTFTGTLDGKGHTITDLVINAGTASDAGLFWQPTNATIEHLRFRGGSVNGNEAAGVVAATAVTSSFTDIYIDDMTVSVEQIGSLGVGGLVGVLGSSGIYDSYFNGTVEGYNYTGGLVGAMSDAEISKSYAAGNVKGGTGGNDIGGLVGTLINASSLSDVYSTANVSTTNGSRVGGLVGTLGNGNAPNPVITRAYATGFVMTTSGDRIGGLGGLSMGETYKSFAVGSVSSPSASDIGGLFGIHSEIDGGIVGQNAFDVTSTGQVDCWSSCSSYGTDTLAVNTSGTEPDYFKNNTTNTPLDTWDFATVWYKTASYPVLAWQIASTGNSNGGSSSGTASAASSNSDASKKTNTQVSATSEPGDSSMLLNDFTEYTSGAGKTLALAIGQVIHFNVEKAGAIEHHTATVKEAGADYAVFTIASTPFDVRVGIGETKIVTIDDAAVMSIRVNSITNSIVDATFTQLRGDTPTKTTAQATPQASQTAPVAAKLSKLFWYLPLGLLLFIIAIIIWKRQHKEKNKKERGA